MNRDARSAFDLTASSFERQRSLPGEAVEAVRPAIWSAAQLPERAWVLDLGAGTGRMAKPFLAAGDIYFGVDSSLAMLQEFFAKPELRKSESHFLAQADGRQLPFRNGVFDVILLMQVLSGAGDWMGILEESRRVLRPGGMVAAGHKLNPDSGVDTQLKRQLATVLQEMQVPWHKSGESRQQALAWLESVSVRHARREVACWNVTTSAQEFLARRRTGARFAALPGPVQEEALSRLHAWAETKFGSVNTSFEERHSFELHIFEF